MRPPLNLTLAVACASTALLVAQCLAALSGNLPDALANGFVVLNGGSLF